MIKINLTDDVCEFYYNQIEKEFTQLLNSLKGEPKLKNLISFLFDKWGHLDEIKLKRLLVGSPHDLEKIISEIGKIPVGGNHRLVKFYKKVSQRKVIREILKEDCLILQAKGFEIDEAANWCDMIWRGKEEK